MLENLFLLGAVLGGGVLVLRVVLMLFGIGDDHSFGVEPDADSLEHSDQDVGTRLLSIQGISAFLMMFGLVGLALTRDSHAPVPVALLGAFGAGVASMWVVAKLYAMMAKLQSSGTLDLASAVGQEGTVYLTIRPGTGGQVQVAVQGRLGVYEAHAQGDDAEIATGHSVRVVGVRGAQLVVERVER